MIDIGSGAGFPGIPLKLVRNDLAFTLVERSAKKAVFLRDVIRRLALTEIRVAGEEAEVLARDTREVESYDVAFSRAVSNPVAQGELVWPFLRKNGFFLLQGTVNSLSSAATNKLERLGFEMVEKFPSCPCAGRRQIITLKKPL